VWLGSKFSASGEKVSLQGIRRIGNIYFSWGEMSKKMNCSVRQQITVF